MIGAYSSVGAGSPAIHPFVVKTYETITKIVELYNADVLNDNPGYDVESRRLQAEYLDNLEVYRPEPDDPTRPVEEYFHPWWYDVSEDIGIAYSVVPANYLECHREQVRSQPRTVSI